MCVYVCECVYVCVCVCVYGCVYVCVHLHWCAWCAHEASTVYSLTITYMSTHLRIVRPGIQVAKDGEFRRKDSVFRNWIRDGDSEFQPEAGRYHLCE